MLRHQLARVERLELGTMADAHHRRIRQPLEDQAYGMLLTLRIEGRGGLVHHEDVGTVDEDPGEGEPLLLAPGQDVLPAGVLVEPSDEVTEPDVPGGPGS